MTTCILRRRATPIKYRCHDPANDRTVLAYTLRPGIFVHRAPFQPRYWSLTHESGRGLGIMFRSRAAAVTKFYGAGGATVDWTRDEAAVMADEAARAVYLNMRR